MERYGVTMKQCISEFISRSWSKEEKFLVIISATLLGIVAGFIFSPFKGINVLSHNGSNNSNNGNPSTPAVDEETIEEN